MNKHTLILLLIIAILAAACTNGDDSDINDPVTVSSTSIATTAPVVTRVVTLTPQPTSTPSPAPTLNETLLPLIDNHTLIMRYTLTESSLVEQIIYSATGVVTVGLDGQISGEGEFSPTLTNGTCPIALEHGDALKFQIEGEVTDSLVAEIQLIPLDAQAAERYVISCYPDPEAEPEITTIEQRLLWAILEGAGLLNFSFDLSQPNTLQPVDISVADMTNREVQGQFVGEVYFGR